jgi:hypothetical protein
MAPLSTGDDARPRKTRRAFVNEILAPHDKGSGHSLQQEAAFFATWTWRPLRRSVVASARTLNPVYYLCADKTLDSVRRHKQARRTKRSTPFRSLTTETAAASPSKMMAFDAGLPLM